MGRQASASNPKQARNQKLRGKFGKGSKSNASTNPNRQTKGNTSGSFNTFRTKATINRLNMYNDKPDKKKLYVRPTEAARVQPDRKWFGNVRTVDQKALEKLRIEMAKKEDNPRNILIKKRNLPMSLLSDPVKENKIRLLDVETYEETFGPKSRRKKIKLQVNSLEEMAEKVVEKTQTYEPEKDRDIKREELDEKDENRDKRMAAGQSKRIWEELYKVLDSSDVLVQILDARDPEGTRSKVLEEHIKKNCPHKHLVILLNKCDLVPVWVTAKWAKYLSKDYPTIAYRASISNPFGKGALINLFRQFDNFHKDKKSISIGFIGYPNVGKSSVINSLKEKKVCKAAPIPGETKVWQYIALTKRIYLIDCPGVVHVAEGKSDINSVLRGCVRAERIDDPCYYIPEILNKVRPEHIKRIYGVEKWEDEEDFLKQLAIKKGKLRKGGEPDSVATAKIILMDWQRGEIPFYNLPPGAVDKYSLHQNEKPFAQMKQEEFNALVDQQQSQGKEPEVQPEKTQIEIEQ